MFQPPRRSTSNNVIFPPLSLSSLIFCARMPNDAQECNAVDGWMEQACRTKHQPSHDDDGDGSDPLWAVVLSVVCRTPLSSFLPSFLPSFLALGDVRAGPSIELADYDPTTLPRCSQASSGFFLLCQLHKWWNFSSQNMEL